MLRGPGIHEREVCSGGLQRTYRVHVPRDYDARTHRSLLMVLHGGGGSAAFASRVHGWRELSHRTGCLAVFPQAECEDPLRAASFRDNPRLWNDGSTRTPVARRNVDDVEYLAHVLDDLSDHYALDGSRVFVTGFSNGASMAFRVGVELAHRIAAIAPVAGHLCLADPQPARPLSMLYIIGLQDPFHPFDGGLATTPWGATRQRPPVMNSISAWIRLIGASDVPQALHESEGVRVVRYGPGPGGQEVRLCTIAGQGHEWPGGHRTLPKSVSGPQTDQLNATQMIWEFFVAEREKEAIKPEVPKPEGTASGP